MKIIISEGMQTLRLGNRLWVLTEDFRFTIDGKDHVIPKGFLTDGASNIRLLWWLCAPVAGPFGEGAVWHDFGYNEGPELGRSVMDGHLFWFGRHRKATWLRAILVKYGVRLMGRSSYKAGKSKLVASRCYDFKYAVEQVSNLRRYSSYYRLGQNRSVHYG